MVAETRTGAVGLVSSGGVRDAFLRQAGTL